MKKQIKLAAIALFLLVPFIATSQPEFDDDVDDVPVDGGISVLLIAGAAYGAKRMNDFKKKSI